MPPMESKSSSENNIVENGEIGEDELSSASKEDKENNKNIEDSSVLLDLLSTELQFGLESLNVPSETVTKTNSEEPDLLDLLGGLELEPHVQSSGSPPAQNILLERYLTSQPDPKGIPSITVFDKSGLKIIFNFDKPLDNPEMIVINLYATNYSYEPIYDFLFQAAVPKVFQLQLLPPTNNILPANNLGNIQQTLKILNPSKSQLRMKLRISYVHHGNSVLEQAEVNNIPQEIYM